jgi:hypothetical protein
MSDAPTLFDAPGARRSDDQAVHDAASRAAHGLPTSRGLMLGVYLGGLGALELTPSEAAERLVTAGKIPVARMDSHRRRVADLVAAGYLEACGERDRGTVYRLTPQGRQEAARVNAATAREGAR